MKQSRLPATAVAAFALAAVALYAVLTLVTPTEPSAARRGPTPRGLPPHAAAIVADAASGTVYYGDGERRALPIASVTKLMTALVTLEREPLDALFTAPPYPSDGDESRMWLATGEQVTVGDLLRGLLLPSGNDAAAALAVGVAGSREAFVALMNARARELGMHDTRYADPIGLDDGNRSSAADLVTLTRALRRHAFFRATVATPHLTTVSGAWARRLDNTNDLLGGPLHVNGVKTGHTKAAGYVLVGSATKRGRTVISVVLGTRSERDRDDATLRLLRYGLKRDR
ncbi:serine hydrolase [Conexibacter sp. JD483]|uniref:D-alanyl-D-alanine carboxypeptidase family protein n=1 Tax=unclassified Conexibacter TaxID=2627773 RepID=UPI0027182DF9|nr:MULTISPECIES: serine hydrolase [unclassified Conexibacter]MDO8188644.1 serine hydrolase [Conexibacter sp. CPCC 205706]MDO8201520.1 serine hydrolase [Conexibacter sp. CPCC 205762]MDR9370739.1 serine hydrolase [Conexibacter sp. JD483]